MSFSVLAATAILRRTPPTLEALLTGLPAEWWQATEGGETWSAFDVVGHLIHGERTDWIPRARIILEHGEAHPFEPFDRLAQRTASRGLSLEDLLTEFRQLRADNVATLEAWQLTDSELGRTGTHPEFGRVTLRQLIATWTVHDLNHLGQIARTMARRYGEEVGPWARYLRILRA
jgi:hypothetical protein